jgi:hypothetical protein
MNGLCEDCLKGFVIPRLRDDDLLILQYLFNENITMPQVARNKHTIGTAVELSTFCTTMALNRLECYNLVKLQMWSKAYNYYITEDGMNALKIISDKIGGEAAC